LSSETSTFSNEMQQLALKFFNRIEYLPKNYYLFLLCCSC